MPHLSVFIEMMMSTIYGPKCIHAKKKFCKKGLTLPFVKLFFKFLFQFFLGFLLPFHFRPLIIHLLVCYFLLLENGPKLEIIENSLRNNRCLRFGP